MVAILSRPGKRPPRATVPERIGIRWLLRSSVAPKGDRHKIVALFDSGPNPLRFSAAPERATATTPPERETPPRVLRFSAAPEADRHVNDDATVAAVLAVAILGRPEG
ncbi:hypothetical protein ACFXDF_18965 [Streptomyces sp. NPDC059426]|uniref:hypothetical protein n=1 Tax=Streptomyces sp. NPDC059426 TaxID=3346827 RepID=UPI0036CC2585